MTRKLPGLIAAIAVLWGVFGIGSGCTPTDREFATGGQGGCPAGFVECDGDPATICETDTRSSSAHCGECNNACSPAPEANVGCVDSKCAITSCNGGKANCNNFYEDGCETNPTTNLENCGICQNSCVAPNAITACVAGACQLAQCVAGKLDCDMDPKTGCEIDPATDVNHCGGCGMACTAPHATMACANAMCALAACDANFDNCNQTMTDGCEVDLQSNPYNCGMCGNGCSGGACKAGVCNPPSLVGKIPFPPGRLALFKSDLVVGSRVSSGEVATLTTAGGPVNTFIAGVGIVNALLATTDAIYVAGSAGMVRYDWAGGSKFSFGTQPSRGVALGTGQVFWTALSTIRESPLLLGMPTTFVSAVTTTYGLFLDANDILYWGLADGTVWSSPTKAAMPVQIASGPSPALNVLADDTNVYWFSGKGVHMASLKSGKDVVLDSSGGIRSIAIDATHLYWTDETDKRVLRTLKDGSSANEVLALDQPAPFGLALDNQFVYWTTSDSGEVWKLPK